jgi:hypothetical protein
LERTEFGLKKTYKIKRIPNLASEEQLFLCQRNMIIFKTGPLDFNYLVHLKSWIKLIIYFSPGGLSRLAATLSYPGSFWFWKAVPVFLVSGNLCPVAPLKHSHDQTLYDKLMYF